MCNVDNIICPSCGKPLPRAAFGTRPDGYRRGYCKRCECAGFIKRRKMKQVGRALKRVGL